MNEKASIFQIILFSVIVVLIIFAILLFSNQSSSGGEKLEEIKMWGLLPEEIIFEIQKSINIEDDYVKIKYVQFQEENFEGQLIESLASGAGPDLVLLPDELLYKHKNKLYNIPYASYPQKDFQNNYIEAGDILLDTQGFYGFPYIIDPLVMYSNRSMLNSVGISRIPSTWNDILDATPLLTKVDNNLNLLKSAIAMGEYKNVENAKDIFVILAKQAGTAVIKKNKVTDSEIENEFEILLKDSNGQAQIPAVAALNFYSQFSNPNINVYSWNRSLPNSKDMFLAGDLAFYIGYASEYSDIMRKNPNLNFTVSLLPQKIGEELNKKTLAKMTTIGVLKQSSKINSAMKTASYLTNNDSIKILSEYLNLPPVKRKLLEKQNSNTALDVFNQSALISKIFWDPDKSQTDKIFREMVESYTSGRVEANSAIERANEELIDLIK